MGCTAEEIAEKRRKAMERLKETKAQTSKLMPSKNPSPETDTKPTSIFYGNNTNQKANQLNQYELKMKNQHGDHSKLNRILSQPYPKRDGTDTKTTSFTTNTTNAQKPFAQKPITCTCSMISPTRFKVVESDYSAKLIDIYKSIPNRSYGKCFLST